MQTIKQKLSASRHESSKPILEHAGSVVGYLELMKEDFESERLEDGSVARPETIEDLPRRNT